VTLPALLRAELAGPPTATLLVLTLAWGAVSRSSASPVYKNLTTAGVVALVFRCRPLDSGNPDSAAAVAVRWADLAEIVNLMVPTSIRRKPLDTHSEHHPFEGTTAGSVSQLASGT